MVADGAERFHGVRVGGAEEVTLQGIDFHEEGEPFVVVEAFQVG